jgi:hypothetical protein
MEYPSETKVCQNCKSNFVIEADDFSFYEKIKVPPPTFCPECRLQRKMIRRNERSLYKNTCCNCKKEMFSMYQPDSIFTVCCNECFWSDKLDLMSYEQDYDFLKIFFKQFYEFSLKVPRISLFQKGNINSIYTNHSDHNKNCYLAFNNGFIEDSMYSKWGISSRQIIDCYNVSNSELCYELNECSKCSRSAYLFFCKGCIDSRYLYSCRYCTNCYLSSNLRNKSYVFENKQYTKEEYKKKIKEISDDSSYKTHIRLRGIFDNKILLKTTRKFRADGKVVNSFGDYLFSGCKNLKKCFHLSKSENCAYCVDDSDVKDSYDVYESAFNCELQYDCHGCNRTSNSKFDSVSYDSNDISYSDMCHNSSNLFGCIGLRSKQYCILNRQYTKEQYEELVGKIIQHMSDMPYIDQKGRVYKYGEFFPSELSPFCYNETIAQEYFPLTKEEAISQGYRWKEKVDRDYNIDIYNKDIPDNITDITDDITDKIIECAHKGECNQQCTEAFKIIPEELQFYRRMNLPLPRLCPNCRHYERLSQRNPLKLWHRTCMKKGCTNEFETSYSPERPEIVYCEKCYQQEVY